MKKTTEYSWKAGFVAGFFVLAIFCIFGWIGVAIGTHMQKCKHPGCDEVHMEGSKYCASHMSSDEWKQWRQSHCSSRSTSHTATTSTSVYYPSGSRTEESTHSGSNGNTTRRTNSSYSNTTNRTSSYDSYDDGYDDVYMDDDYDDYRYEHDAYYRDGVDDAIDEMEDDW